MQQCIAQRLPLLAQKQVQAIFVQKTRAEFRRDQMQARLGAGGDEDSIGRRLGC